MRKVMIIFIALTWMFTGCSLKGPHPLKIEKLLQLKHELLIKVQEEKLWFMLLTRAKF